MCSVATYIIAEKWRSTSFHVCKLAPGVSNNGVNQYKDATITTRLQYTDCRGTMVTTHREYHRVHPKTLNPASTSGNRLRSQTSESLDAMP